jgi:hypothetical protein
MSVHAPDFLGQIVLHGKKNRHYPTLAAEMNAIAAALGPDTITHDLTIKLPIPALRPGHTQTPFTNAALHIVNMGKAGNLPNATMQAQINAALGSVLAPVNTAPPVASGTGVVGNTLTATQGTWLYASSYSYLWLRNGVGIGTATTLTYVLQAADSGTNISFRVIAINPAGSANVISNAIAVA